MMMSIVDNSGHFMSLGDLAKLAITFAGVDSFYSMSMMCLQLNDTLLLQNFVKIRHCLPEL